MKPKALVTRLTVFSLALFLLSTNACAQTEATRILQALNYELRQDMVQVADNVYVFVGYGVSTVSVIVGDDGLIFVDAGSSPSSTAEILVRLRQITDLPSTALIYTHSHLDHLGGAAALVEDSGELDVFANENFGSERAAFRRAGIKIHRQRGAMQAGMLLPMEQRINNGIAPAVPPFGGFVAEAGTVEPTHFVDGARQTVSIAGVTLDLLKAPGETADQLYVWLPESRVLFAGDNFYRSWPNLYAIRGTPYRDILDWTDSLNAMIGEDARVLVAGHTRPVLGEGLVKSTLTNYRDAITQLFEKTVEGINKGLGPDQLVSYVELDPDLAAHKYLMPFYGHPDWAIRSIFSGYLGWFDGNATNLFPLGPQEEATRILELAGGREQLLANAREALQTDDLRWAAQLADYLIVLDKSDSEAKATKADAMEALAARSVNALARNYYLSTTQKLRESGAQSSNSQSNP